MNSVESHPITVSAATFNSDVLDASRDQTVLVDFWAAWCGPCKALTAPLNEIAAERAGQLVVAKVDVDENPELAERYHIRSIPALLLFRGGEVAKMIVGLRPKAEILRHVDAIAPTASGQSSI
jgi:thioredoxin 1